MKIFDCTTFYNEKMMMDVRFNILNEYVSKFIVVESLYSHSGKKKKLNFDINDYPKFKEKIRYIVIEKEPEGILQDEDKNKHLPYKRLNSIKRIEQSYNYMSNGIEDANDEDLIILSDNDEIPNLQNLDFGKINSNWKFLIENFIEPYHVQFVHKTTTNQPLKDHYTIVDGICYGSGINVKQEDEKNSNALSVTSKYLSLFPNFIIGTYYPNQIGVYLNIPIGPGITSQKRIIYSTGEKPMSKEEIDITKKIWWSVHKEDHEMCERLQEGRSSPASNDGGLLSPHWEKGVQKFQKLIIQATMKSKKMKGKKNV